MAPFAALTKRGDAILKVKLLEILYEYFGSDNISLINQIIDLVVSNDTCRHLALAYRLNLYLGLPPRKKSHDKWWGDVWEAYWAALFIERRLWNDDDEELTNTLRTLIHLQFEVLFREVGVRPFLTLSPFIRTQDPESSLGDDDIDIHPSYLKVPAALQHKPLGHLIKVKRTGAHCFAQEPTEAISQLNLYAAATWSTSPQPWPFRPLLFSPSLSTVC